MFLLFSLFQTNNTLKYDASNYKPPAHKYQRKQQHQFQYKQQKSYFTAENNRKNCRKTFINSDDKDFKQTCYFQSNIVDKQSENSYSCDIIDIKKTKVHCNTINSIQEQYLYDEQIFNHKKPKLKRIYRLMKSLLKETFRNKTDQRHGDSTYVEVSLTEIMLQEIMYANNVWTKT